MQQKQLFLKSLSTLFHSWGSDTPPEVTWGANELLDWYEAEYNVKLNIRFCESYQEPDLLYRPYEDVIERIQNI